MSALLAMSPQERDFPGAEATGVASSPHLLPAVILLLQVSVFQGPGVSSLLQLGQDRERRSVVNQPLSRDPP